MSRIEPVNLEELVFTKKRIILEIENSLTDTEKEFLISFKSLEPKWDLLEMPNIKNLPAVIWKLLNLKNMEVVKRKEAILKLKKILIG